MREFYSNPNANDDARFNTKIEWVIGRIASFMSTKCTKICFKSKRVPCYTPIVYDFYIKQAITVYVKVENFRFG